MKITGKTKLGMVIGSPIAGSLSPIMHNAAINSLGLDAVFVPAEIKPYNFKNYLASLSDINLFGISVTMPLKEIAAENLKLSPIAHSLKAVNTIYRKNDELIGDNTDGQGFVEALKYKFDFNFKNNSAFVLGAGGAARAIVSALSNAGCSKIIVSNRSEERVGQLIKLTGNVAKIGPLSDAQNCDLVVNSTSVGMNNTEVSDIDPFESVDFKSNQIVFDIITSPTKTKFLEHAILQGANVAEGFYMLVFQGAVAFKRFCNQEAPVEVMLNAVKGVLEI